MKKVLTVTRKGQATLPAAIRRKLGLGSMGGVLQISFNEQREELIISKPTQAADLSKRISRHLKADTKPLTDVGSYYQQHRRRT